MPSTPSTVKPQPRKAVCPWLTTKSRRKVTILDRHVFTAAADGNSVKSLAALAFRLGDLRRKADSSLKIVRTLTSKQITQLFSPRSHRVSLARWKCCARFGITNAQHGLPSAVASLTYRGIWSPMAMSMRWLRFWSIPSSGQPSNISPSDR